MVARQAYNPKGRWLNPTLGTNDIQVQFVLLFLAFKDVAFNASA